MKLSQPKRITAAVLILAASASYSIGEYCWERNPFARYRTDAITRNLRRFEELKKILAPHGTVGYVSDKVGDDGIWDYYQAQYALAPVILEMTAEREIVVGNFQDPSNAHQTLMNGNLTIQKDFGNGVFLLTRRTQ